MSAYFAALFISGSLYMKWLQRFSSQLTVCFDAAVAESAAATLGPAARTPRHSQQNSCSSCSAVLTISNISDNA